MPEAFYFPIYSGLLSPEHREQIGPAIWEFLWFISKTTKEFQEGDETLGIVLGGKPIKHSEIAEELGISESTVKRNVNRLKINHYIESKRAPYGEIYIVKNSKKFKTKRKVKNDLSKNRDRSYMNRDRSHMTERQTTYDLCNKDIKDIKGYKNKEEEENIVNQIIDLLQKSEIVQLKDINEFLREDINDVIDNFGFVNPEEMIVAAIKESARGNGKTWLFVYNKLRKWRKEGISTVEQLEDFHLNIGSHKKKNKVDWDELARRLEDE